MNALIQKTAKKISVDYCRLSIVRNPDGFLAREEVRRALSAEQGLTVVVGSNLKLRVLYELELKRPENTERVVYVTTTDAPLVPDIREAAHVTDFAVADLFPLFADKSLLEGLDLDTLTAIDAKCGFKKIPMWQCRQVVEDAKRILAEQHQRSAESIRQRAAQITTDWSRHADDIMQQTATCMVDAVRFGVQDAIEVKITELNQQFQAWIDDNYFAALNSNALMWPRSVNRILPHLAERCGTSGKVALIVVDGLAYWEYYVLQQHLQQEGFSATGGTTLAWIPTITMLSRQAIFRGDTPKQNYKQSTESEKAMWKAFWQQEGVPSASIQYLSDKDTFAVNEGVTRLAYVTAEMDEKMHSSSDYKDLLSLTENWCPRITQKIATLRQMGFSVLLTTDHGGLLSHGWKPISAVEKVFLYKDGSRGKRHLIYTNMQYKNDFVSAHKGELNMLSRGQWLAMRDDACFEREGKEIITHGGSHFMEVVIPFVQIK